MKKDECPDGDFSPSYYDGECGNPDDEPEHGSPEEVFDMHKWAYDN